MSMSIQYWCVIWTVGFAETKRLWDTNVRASNILNWHWLTMLGLKITLSGALRTNLFFSFVWRRFLDCDVVSRNVWKEYFDIWPLWFSIKVNVVNVWSTDYWEDYYKAKMFFLGIICLRPNLTMIQTKTHISDIQTNNKECLFRWTISVHCNPKLKKNWPLSQKVSETR